MVAVGDSRGSRLSPLSATEIFLYYFLKGMRVKLFRYENFSYWNGWIFLALF